MPVFMRGSAVDGEGLRAEYSPRRPGIDKSGLRTVLGVHPFRTTPLAHIPLAREDPMREPIFIPSRRVFLASAGVALFTTRGLFAEELVKTPAQTEGPFYPNKLPLDTDNDLLIVNDAITPAVGEVTHLTGKILDAKGNPV